LTIAIYVILATLQRESSLHGVCVDDMVVA